MSTTKKANATTSGGATKHRGEEEDDLSMLPDEVQDTISRYDAAFKKVEGMANQSTLEKRS